MEDFGLFRGSKSLDYSGTWEDTDCISEAKMAKLFSDQGLRYKMSKTEEEEAQHEPLLELDQELQISGKLLVSQLHQITKLV